jgi:hypothetical protein
VPVALQDSLPIPDALAHLTKLAAEREALGHGVRSHDRGGTSVERVGQSRGVPRAAGKLDRLAAQPIAPIAGRFVAKRSS